MKTPVYLDNNATTPLDPAVLEEMLPVLQQHFGNPASGTHPYGWYAEELVQIARERVAAAIAAAPEEIVFTSGATESCNLALKGFVAGLKSGRIPHCITAATEHRAVLDPLRQLEARGAIALTILSVDEEGFIAPEQLRAALRPESALVALMLANNEIGTIQDIAALSSIAREASCTVFCDATQAVGKIPVNVKELGVDLLALSAHKLYGPKGVGALYVHQSLRSRLEALMDGGGHEQGLRSGTLNTAGIVGLGAACARAAKLCADDRQRIDELRELLHSLLLQCGEITLNGSAARRLPGNLNLCISGVDNVRLLALTNTKVAYSVSSACQSHSSTPSHVLQALGLSVEKQRASIRLGIGRFTTKEEVRYSAEVLSKAITRLRAR